MQFYKKWEKLENCKRCGLWNDKVRRAKCGSLNGSTRIYIIAISPGVIEEEIEIRNIVPDSNGLYTVGMWHGGGKLSCDFDKYENNILTPNCIKEFWRFLNQCNTTIETTRTWKPLQGRKWDVAFTEVFANKNFTAKEMKYI
jgi:hypothetical protein